MKDIKYFMIFAILPFLLCGCGKINYQDYVNKIWVIAEDGTEEGMTSTRFSFYITDAETDSIKGKCNLKGGVLVPGFSNEKYLENFSGTITDGKMECQFEDVLGNEGIIKFLSWDEDTIRAEIKGAISVSWSQDEEIDGEFCFRPYRISDLMNFTANEEYSFETVLDDWGQVCFVSGRSDNFGKGTYYPEVFLTDENENILYELNAGYLSGFEVSGIEVKDLNGDGRKDVTITTQMTYEMGQDDYYAIEWISYQMEDGQFYLNERREMQ